MTTIENDYLWLRHSKAEALLSALIDDFKSAVPYICQLEVALLERTGSLLIDWLDHVVVSWDATFEALMGDLGFRPEEVDAPDSDQVYCHPGAVFPRIVLRKDPAVPPASVLGVGIHVEEINSFLAAHHVAAPIQGTPLSLFRLARVWQANDRYVLLVERRGHNGFLPTSMPPDYADRYLRAYERWATRPREFTDARDGMATTLDLARELTSELGTDAAAWLAFAAERFHWQSRNRAGRVQKARQDSLGLGWANHDHHTFRSSRAAFPLLIEILETFGFRPRERFYAGAEAGWGAQVMEQPACRFAVFADVDLSPDEVEGDFAHQVLSPRAELGTVGLWCALHGESMLSAGLHHLAGRFDFAAATTELAKDGIGMMRPFSDFAYLRQAFTKGERWQVRSERLDSLVQQGKIDGAQRIRFAEQGAIGSHLENIQRGEGFKGFNQQTVSDIILRTDPRAGLPTS